MKTKEEIMRILEAFDLTGSYRAAAELVGVDPHTVRRYVQVRRRGGDPAQRPQRPKIIDPFMPKIEEMIDRSSGRIGADKVHEKISAMGFTGTSRTTRRAVAAARAAFHVGHRRVVRPWVPEPGLWLQWDWGNGPEVARGRSWLWCAWLGWSRFRIVIPVLDKTLPAMAHCLDVALRKIGGAPTYVLAAEQESSAERHTWTPEIGHHYGLIMKTYVTADAQSGACSERARVAARDLVPTGVHAHLASSYRNFAELEAACNAFAAEVNARPFPGAQGRPVEALVDEAQWLHPLPSEPFAPEG